MFLLQITQPPVLVHIADDHGQPQYEVQIPKYKLGDTILWGSALSERWREQQMQGLTDNERRDYNTMYPAIPPTLSDLKRAVASLEGVEEVITTSFAKARIFKCVPHEKKVKVKGKDKDDKPTSETRTVTTWKRGEEITEGLEGLRKNLLDQILTGNGTGTLTAMAWNLADFVDTSAILPPQKKLPKDDDEEEEESPL